MSLFINAHACILVSSTFNLGNSTLWFKVKEGECVVGDATYVKFVKDDYGVRVKQDTPWDKPNDYYIEFYDHTVEHGLATMGIFSSNGKNAFDHKSLIKAKGKTFLLSDIIKYYKVRGFNTFYLNVCRTPCKT
tara:strand:+ start:1372 stop:1770 length:399 start_codon:yes stop_codon:yes gene_type:complete